MRGALALLLLVLWPARALAQGVAPDAGTELDELEGEIARDYGEALANDCPTACRALESMRRAAEHLCALDAGERCAEARQKVTAATDRVRAACPSCAQALGGPPSPSPASAPPPAQAVELESSPSKRGGCAGCAVSPVDGDRLAPLAAAAVVALLARRRRRRAR